MSVLIVDADSPEGAVTLHLSVDYVPTDHPYDRVHRGRWLRAYEVWLDGERKGKVYEVTETSERRSPGARYVNARWTSPRTRWQFEGAAVRLTFATRAGAAAAALGYRNGRIR